MINAIYNVIITPLSIIFEFFYTLIYEITKNKGLSVIALSFVVAFLTLPIYMVAETWSEKERAIQNKMKYWLSHIKKAFSGDGGGVRFSEKIQIYLLAFIFLILLYNSPSGLVVYWTMNNILSLTKNIFYKLKNPKKVLYIILCVFSAVCVGVSFTVLLSAAKILRMMILLFGLILPYEINPFAKILFNDENWQRLYSGVAK